MSEKSSILVIDSERLTRELLGEYLVNLGYRVFPAATISSALDILASNDIPVALIDTGPSSANDMASVDRLKKNRHRLRVILVVGYPTLTGVIEAVRHGVFDLVVKPFRLDDLKDCLGRAFRTSVAGTDMEALQNRISELENILKNNGITPPGRKPVPDRPLEQAAPSSKRPLTPHVSSVSLDCPGTGKDHRPGHSRNFDSDKDECCHAIEIGRYRTPATSMYTRRPH